MAHLDPEAFILLGGLSKAGDILLKPTIAAMERNLFNACKGKVKVSFLKRQARTLFGDLRPGLDLEYHKATPTKYIKFEKEWAFVGYICSSRVYLMLILKLIYMGFYEH